MKEIITYAVSTNCLSLNYNYVLETAYSIKTMANITKVNLNNFISEMHHQFVHLLNQELKYGQYLCRYCIYTFLIFF